MPEVLHKIKVGGPSWDVAFSPCGSRLAMGVGHSVMVAELIQGIIWCLGNHPDNITRVLWCDEKSLLTTSEDGTLNLWTLGSKRPIGLNIPNTGGKVAMCPATKTLATLTGKEIEVWDIQNLLNLQKRTTLEVEEKVFHMDFSPSGDTLITAIKDGFVTAWDLSNAKATQLGEYQRIIFGVAYAPDANTIASCGYNGAVQSINPSSNSYRTFHTDGDGLFCVTFSPDGKKLAACGADGRIWLFTPSLKRIATLQTGKNVFKVAFSPDSTLLASCEENMNTIIWRI